MSANDLLQLIADVLYVLIFLVVVWRAVRQPRRASIDTALFFGVFALIIVESWAVAGLGLKVNGLLLPITQTLLMSLPYFLLRLVDDFSTVPRWLLWGAGAGLAICTVSFFVVPPQLYPLWMIMLCVLYFFGLTI